MPSGVILKGTNAVQLIRTRRVKDPNLGVSIEQEWHGMESGIVGLELSYANARNTWTERGPSNGPLRTLLVRFGGETPTEAIDTWRVRYESLEKDAFLHPSIVADAGLTNTADYRKSIEEAVSGGKPSSTFTLGSVKQRLYYELCRGATHYRSRYLVLSCRRTVSAAYTGTFTVASEEGPIYSTGQLPVPSGILAKLPGQTGNAFPVNPNQSQWGWLNFGFETDFVGTRAEVNLEFVCAAWSTLYYTPSGGNFTF